MRKCRENHGGDYLAQQGRRLAEEVPDKTGGLASALVVNARVGRTFTAARAVEALVTQETQA